MTDAIPTQLTLGVRLNDEATFANFLVNEANQQLIQNLQGAGAAGQVFYLWGPASVGITHLLQAMCHREAVEHGGALYLPMLQNREFTPEILLGTNSLSLVCIDNIEVLCGDAAWEAALFTAFNAIRESDTTLLLGSNTGPQNLEIELADLDSRLKSSLIYHLKPLDEAEKLRALQMRAANRGMQLSNPVVDFIYQRGDRSMSGLMEVLEKLDESSLLHKRSLTIPLVKTTMNW